MGSATMRLIERKPGGIGFEYMSVEQHQGPLEVAKQAWPDREEVYFCPGWGGAKLCVWIPHDPPDPRAAGWTLEVVSGDPTRIPRWRPPASEAPVLDVEPTAGEQLGLFDLEGT